ncbi:MAG: hypothetical protein H6867_07530 [Rhodospirillales bacterium]|nr:hypothetical protein [Rhodospirillales bacterium]MCB9995402.1 hypothetical protein [Rhodospirillales bacterium]
MKIRHLLAMTALTALMTPAMSARADDINPNLAKLKEIQAQMAAQGVEMKLPMATEAPEDAYQGEDKAKILEMVDQAWKEKHPDDEVLGMRIQMEEWDRYQDKRWSDADEDWYPVDYSELQTWVIVKKDETTATMWPVNVTKDHLDGEKLGVDVTGVKDVDLMSRDILLENLHL